MTQSTGFVLEHGSKPLRPRARLLRTLGAELISSDTVAVAELVKNAYDADATMVLVRFTGELTRGKGSLEVMDNGHGMSLETVTTAWLEPATSYRKRNSLSERLGRRVLGEKGIGRFAASRLSDELMLITRRTGSGTEVVAYFDWSQFDDDSKYLDEVQILFEEKSPYDIRPGGAIDDLWQSDDFEVGSEADHGTILRMDRLSSDWTTGKIQDLSTALSRLVSPLFGQQAAKNQFRIVLDLPEKYIRYSRPMEPPEIVKHPHYAVSGKVDVDGNYRMTVTVKGESSIEEGMLTVRGEHDERTKPVCGPLAIELRVWDRDRDALNPLIEGLESSLPSLREDLDSVAGVAIYRDGFRVLPYGEPNNDWARLDLRSRQNPTLHLANNQVLGNIFITSDLNRGLRDQSNREGLMENTALDHLRQILLQVLAILETRRYASRRSPVSMAAPRMGLFEGFSLDRLVEQVKERYPRDTQMYTLMREVDRDLRQRISRVQSVLSRYHKLATLGQLIDSVLHEGRTPLAKIRNEAYIGKQDLGDASLPIDIKMERSQEHFDKIDRFSEDLALAFRRIEPFGGRSRGRPSAVVIEDVIADAFGVLSQEVSVAGISVDLPATRTATTVDRSEIQSVIVNLLHNSVYWLKRVPKDARKIIVSVGVPEPGIVEIIFSDSGPGVDPRYRDIIFDAYFSTKPNGVGLGLSIAGEIVSDYYDGKLELMNHGPLSGATFRITLRRRVSIARVSAQDTAG